MDKSQFRLLIAAILANRQREGMNYTNWEEIALHEADKLITSSIVPSGKRE